MSDRHDLGDGTDTPTWNCGDLDYGDRFDERVRYPADYAFRRADVVVKKRPTQG